MGYKYKDVDIKFDVSFDGVQIPDEFIEEKRLQGYDVLDYDLIFSEYMKQKIKKAELDDFVKLDFFSYETIEF